MYRIGIGFDHCVKFNNPVAGTTFADWVTSCGYTGPSLGSSLTACGIDQDGWLGGYSTTLNQVVPLVLQGIVPPLSTKVTIGFRIKTLNAYGSSHSIIHLCSSASPADLTTYLFLAGAPGAPWLAGVGVEYHVELTYNFATGIVQGLVNGVAIPDYTPPALPAAIKAAWAAGTGAINFRLGNNLNARYAIRDITIVDDLAGDNIVGPVGPQRLYPLYTDDVQGPGWTATTGGQTLIQSLTAPLPATGRINSPVDKTPLQMSLKCDAPPGSRVTGISLAIGGVGLGDAPTTAKMELIQGGQTSQAKFVTLPRGTPGYGALMGTYAKAPDGLAWDLAKLDATTVKLTPDTPA